MIIDNSHITVENVTVRVLYSPILEIVSSLHCLKESDSYPQYANECEKIFTLMDEPTRAEFDYLSEMSLNWTLSMDFICYLEQHNIESAKDFMANFPFIDTTEFMYGMLSGFVPKKTIARLLKDPSSIETWNNKQLESYMDLAFARKLLANASELQSRMAAFIKWYWENAFEKIWAQIGAGEINCHNAESKMLSDMGGLPYVETCHEDLQISNGVITVSNAQQFAVPITSLTTITVMLTAFKGPDLMMNNFDGELTVFKSITPERPTAKDINIDEFESFLKSVSSYTKLEILKSLYEAPKTTKELSDELGMAPSSISEHLKTLRAAELLYPQRIKNSVYNRFLYENYQAFASYLLHYFEK